MPSASGSLASTRRLRALPEEIYFISRLRCRHCGQVIGVYEPLVSVAGGEPYETSRAAEPEVARGAGPWYHAACYDLLAGGESGAE
jgi:hypothetical protein